MDADLKRYTDNLIANLSGMTSLVQKNLEKTLEDLKQQDPSTGSEKIKEFAEAMKNSNIADSFGDLNKKINELKSL